MYNRAKYYSKKFIQMGAGGLLLSVILIYSSVTKNEGLNPLAIILPIGAIVFLYLGSRISNKLKLKDAAKDSSEITDERISFKSIEFILAVLLVVMVVLSINHWKYVNYMAISLIILYISWYYMQMKLINNYLRT